MKSIRRSLILNLLVLLGLALGAVCALLYGLTQQALQAKEEAVLELLQRQFEEERDHELLAQARTVADLAQSQFQSSRLRQLAYLPLGALVAAPSPQGHLQVPFWLAEGMRGPVSFRISFLLTHEIRLEDDFPTRDDAASHEYIQVNGEWGSVWRSHTLGDRKLPLDPSALAGGPQINWRFDDVEVTPGVPARRVLLRAPLRRSRFLWSGPPRGGPGPDFFRARALLAGGAALVRPESPRGDRGDRPPRPPVVERSLPTIFVQCAWDSETHPILVALRAKYDRRVADLKEETRRGLSGLRKRMLGIGLIAFAAVVIGGSLLVGVGLAPLRRLSEAVSRVSPKDFRLPVEPREQPREVLPVVERLTQTLALLQRAFEREKQAAADISHELRTPLAALLTTLDVALRKPRAAEEYRETLSDCREIARQMRQLVERLLALAWLDAGADRVKPQPVDVNEVVSGCAAVARPLAEAHGLAFRVRVEPALVATTDPDKLREVVLNLVHNAIEYNRPGGEVEVSAFPRPAGGLVVEVRDTGVGMPPEIHDKIFERFYRSDPSRNATGVHAGLGLALVKEYVDRMGGAVAVESAVGVGSRFRVELPDVK